jgi:hypothetical protein
MEVAPLFHQFVSLLPKLFGWLPQLLKLAKLMKPMKPKSRSSVRIAIDGAKGQDLDIHIKASRRRLGRRRRSRRDRRRVRSKR